MNFPKGYNYQSPIDGDCFCFLKGIKEDAEKLQNFGRSNDVHTCSGYMDIGADLTEEEIADRMKYVIVSKGEFNVI